MTNKALTLISIPEQDRQEMTKEESKTFITCMFMERENNPDLIGTGLQLEAQIQKMDVKLFQVQVFLKRLCLASHLKFSMPVVLFLSTKANNVAHVVMWAHFLVQETRKLPVNKIFTMENLAEAFPMGFPTDEAISKLWDKQKLKTMGLPQFGINDNYLDTNEAWS